MIVVQYVDNSGIRYNCRELVDEFYATVRDDGRIDLNFAGGDPIAFRYINKA